MACRLNAVGEFFYDGTTISPFEVVFVAMNTLVVENNWSFARQAAIYQAWLQLQVRCSSTLPHCISIHAALVFIIITLSFTLFTVFTLWYNRLVVSGVLCFDHVYCCLASQCCGCMWGLLVC